jgi:hypothetical protein
MRLALFENGVTKRIFVRKAEKVGRCWRECVRRELIICTSPNSVTVIKSRKMAWAGHVMIMGAKKCMCFNRRTCRV